MTVTGIAHGVARFSDDGAALSKADRAAVIINRLCASETRAYSTDVYMSARSARSDAYKLILSFPTCARRTYGEKKISEWNAMKARGERILVFDKNARVVY